MESDRFVTLHNRSTDQRAKASLESDAHAPIRFKGTGPVTVSVLLAARLATLIPSLMPAIVSTTDAGRIIYIVWFGPFLLKRVE